MLIFKARERKDEYDEPMGKWRYTVADTSTKLVCAIGACAAPCPGHDTPEEANEHQRQWMLDHVAYDRPLTCLRSEDCQVCNAPTVKALAVPLGPYAVMLCEDHLNRDGLTVVLTVGESWES